MVYVLFAAGLAAFIYGFIMVRKKRAEGERYNGYKVYSFIGYLGYTVAVLEFFVILSPWIANIPWTPKAIVLVLLFFGGARYFMPGHRR